MELALSTELASAWTTGEHTSHATVTGCVKAEKCDGGPQTTFYVRDQPFLHKWSGYTGVYSPAVTCCHMVPPHCSEQYSPGEAGQGQDGGVHAHPNGPDWPAPGKGSVT